MACWHDRGSLPAARWAAIYSPAVVVAGIACLGLVLLLTPDRVAALTAPALVGQGHRGRAGRLPGGGDAGAQPLELQALRLPIAITDVVASGITVAGVVVGALVAVAILVALAGMAVGSELLIIWGAGVSFAVLPPAIGVAVLRSRLYDLDRIISRTLACGLLTVLLAGGCAAVALGLGQLLGRDSSLVVTGATLAVAALFQLARRRIQALVDRRFNRRHFDTRQTIAAFSTRLRDQLDLDTLSAEVLAVADQTMEPTMLSLWLRRPLSAPGGPPLDAYQPGAEMAAGRPDTVGRHADRAQQRARPDPAARLHAPGHGDRGAAGVHRRAGAAERAW